VGHVEDARVPGVYLAPGGRARPARAAPAAESAALPVALGDERRGTGRLERAAALLRTTDRAVADICLAVGLRSVGSFTTSFTRAFGMSPTAYRAAFPSAAELALVPTCVLRMYGRPRNRTFREDCRRPRD
jgi:hypothetical protein